MSILKTSILCAFCSALLINSGYSSEYNYKYDQKSNKYSQKKNKYNQGKNKYNQGKNKYNQMGEEYSKKKNINFLDNINNIYFSNPKNTLDSLSAIDRKKLMKLYKENNQLLKAYKRILELLKSNELDNNSKLKNKKNISKVKSNKILLKDNFRKTKNIVHKYTTNKINNINLLGELQKNEENNELTLKKRMARSFPIKKILDNVIEDKSKIINQSYHSEQSTNNKSNNKNSIPYKKETKNSQEKMNKSLYEILLPNTEYDIMDF